MKNTNNTSSDLEDGETAASDSGSDSDSDSDSPVSTVKPSLFGVKQHAVPSWISRRFNVTKIITTHQKALVLLCVAGAIIDPLFFYIPVINERSKCMKSDHKLGLIAISLRSLGDVLHFLLWYYYEKWKDMRPELSGSANAASKEISPANSNRLSPRNSKATMRIIEIFTSKKIIIIEMLCILPLPQVATMAILIIKGSPRTQRAVTLLKFSVLAQFILRAYPVLPSFHEATTNSLTLLKSRFWIGAGFNLLLFVIASHVLGAFWYLLSVGRTMDCWKSACRSRVGCNIDSLYCGGPTDNKTYLDDYCPIPQATNSPPFDFGIYLSALQSNIVGSTQFPLKLSYCFWWGLRNLSSLGQNLATSAYEWEICFSICISILGLILFSLFIGNMQAFFQNRTNEDLAKMKDKFELAKKKRTELLKWELFQWFPKGLQEEIILCVNDSWLKTPDANLWTAPDYLPKDLGEKMKNSIFSQLNCTTNEDVADIIDTFEMVEMKIRKKKKELLKWELFQWLPYDLQKRIRLCMKDGWVKTSEVNLRTALNYLPKKLSKKMKDSIVSKLKSKVKLFEVLNELGGPEMLNRLKAEVFTKGSLVFEKGQPIKHMVFVVNGKLRKQISPDESESKDLHAWDFCGEELLYEILQSTPKDQSAKKQPTSIVDTKDCTEAKSTTVGIKACTEIELTVDAEYCTEVESIVDINACTEIIDAEDCTKAESTTVGINACTKVKWNIEACTEVEAFIVDASDLQNLVNESRGSIYKIWLAILEQVLRKAREVWTTDA